MYSWEVIIYDQAVPVLLRALPGKHSEKNNI